MFFERLYIQMNVIYTMFVRIFTSQFTIQILCTGGMSNFFGERIKNYS